MLLERETTIQTRFHVKFSTPVILAFKKLAKSFLPTLMKNRVSHIFGFQVRGGKATTYCWGQAENFVMRLEKEEGWRRRPFGFPLFEGEGACKGETQNAGEVMASGAAGAAQ